MVDTPNNWKLLYETGRQALQDRKLQEAEQSFSAALQLAEDFAPTDPRLVATLNALARIYSLQRRYLAAAALLNRLLEVTERTLGPSHVQVAGVLTNLAEMYTHLGAAREELELRERVLGIRDGDPNADANTLQRLRDRVAELRATLAAQEPPEPLIDDEPLPIVRTEEYSTSIAVAREPEPVVASKPDPAPEPVVTIEEPEPVVPDPASYAAEIRPAIIESPPELTSSREHETATSFRGSVDHGFSDMGRDELKLSTVRSLSGRSSLYSIAAGVVLIAGLLAARDYVHGSDDAASVSAGSVSLAATMPTPPARAVVVPPVVLVPTASAATPAPDPKTVERLIADRRAEQEARRANEARESSLPLPEATKPNIDRSSRPPTAADIEKTLRNVDVALKSIDQRTKAAADSATAIRLQAPTFKKVKIAEP